MDNKKFLKTHELSVELIQMIAEAKQYCYLVTPYVKLWPQLERALEDASKRGIFLTFIIREDSSNDGLIEKLNAQWGFEVVVVKDMHIKLYLNEKRALLSSMNLYDASQQRNLELGYLSTQHKMMRKDVIENYILKDSSCTRWPGKFESSRETHLAKVKEAKQVLEKPGYCISCQKEIQLDGRPNAYYVQCGSCYYNDLESNAAAEYEASAAVKFCHLCGESHQTTTRNPFHDHCRKAVNELWQLSKDY